MTENSNIIREIIIGRNHIREALKQNRSIDKIYMQKQDMDTQLGRIKKSAINAGIPVINADKQKLTAIAETEKHQGVVAFAAMKAYCSVEEILEYAKESGQPPFIIVVDSVQDPHNLGAIIRTAHAAGVHGIIIPKRDNAGLSPSVGKASAGVIEHMNIARVPNIALVIVKLKKAGLWIYGADMNAAPLYSVDMSGAVAIVVGGESKGLSRIISEKCDYLISIPMKNNVNSLNVSVAAAILMYEAVKARL